MKSDFNVSHIISICNLNYAKKYAGIVYYLWVPEETVLILYNTCTISLIIVQYQILYNGLNIYYLSDMVQHLLLYNGLY